MARTILESCPDAPKHEKSTLMSFKIELITPLFGGGTVAGELDEKLLIRATEIRGVLRFWWRATRGKIFLKDKNPASSLKKMEDEFWGSKD